MLKPEDKYLIKLMTSADETVRQEGWAEWYERDYPDLSTFVNRHSYARGCPEQSQDIIQDSFIKGFENVSSGRYQDRGRSLKAYLYGIAKNLMREAGRLQRGRSAMRCLLIQLLIKPLKSKIELFSKRLGLL
jgi:DNA-directed RNA polymerase specialized sigma24 family protein